MSEAEGGTKQQSERARVAMLALLNEFDPNHLVLSHDEIRLLTLIVTTRDGAEPFVRRMVNISESLKAGRVDAVARLTRQSKDHTLTELLAPMSEAVIDGRLVAVRNTTFLAAGFAYQNSFDYICDLMNYLDSFKHRPLTRNTGGGLRPA